MVGNYASVRNVEYALGCQPITMTEEFPITASNDLPIDLLQQKHQQLLGAATADNTRRAYHSAIRHFLNWGGLLPSNEELILRYLLAFSATLNSRTLALRLTALSQWHVQQGFADPTSTPTVRKTLLGIGRTYGKPKKKAKALPIEDLERIGAYLAALGTLQAMRDNALLQIGYFGGYRRSELVGLQVSDAVWEQEGLVITLARSKTDQLGQGISKAIPYGEGPCCPATALRIWLDAADITSGPIFRSINKWGNIAEQRLHESTVNAALTRCARLVNLDYVPQLSSHSLRRGMATSAYRAGADFQDIKRQGGWRHDGTVQGYIEEAGRFQDNAAGTLLRRRTA
jgi:integrase